MYYEMFKVYVCKTKYIYCMFRQNISRLSMLTCFCSRKNLSDTKHTYNIYVYQTKYTTNTACIHSATQLVFGGLS